jgi:hypothetical protein
MFTFGLVPAVAATDEARRAPVPFAGPAGDEIVEKVLDGIPVHRIAVRSYPDDAVTITVDGHIDEAVWREIPYHDNMIVSIPGTGEPGHYPTEMRIFATARGLYVGAIGRQPVATLVPRMSPRDDFIDRDTFGVTLDTTGEGLFAYWFIVGLGGSLMDGKVLPERNYQRDWDGPWLGASAVRDDGWSAEFFLPWSMMNLPEVEGTRTVGFAVTRSVSHMNERYQWPGHAYTSAQFVTALNQMQCAKECEIQAIHPDGHINHNECHYCLDCQMTYHNDDKCPPLILKQKKRSKKAPVSADLIPVVQVVVP